MVNNSVTVNMESRDYWYAVITKGDYSVILLCDLNAFRIYTFGGKNCSICKNIKYLDDIDQTYSKFMFKIGKMCKKSVDPTGKYFSDTEGFVADSDLAIFVTTDIQDKITGIVKECLCC